MKKISSKTLFYSKTIFPIVWFGFLAYIFIISIANRAYEQSPMYFIMPGFMAVFGYFLMKKLVWDLVDEVYDCGDYLLIKNRGVEESVPFSNIMNVNASMNMNPPRITLRLVRPGTFGQEISFIPAASFTLNPLAKNPLAEELIIRVDNARSKRAL